MAGRYKAYPEYKNSDIEALPRLPVDWSVSKVRFIATFGRGLGITKANLQDTGIPCVSYGEIHSKFGFEVCPSKHPLKCVDEKYLLSDPYALLSKGDLVFADTSEDIEGAGSFTQLISDAAVFAGYHTVTVRPSSENNSRYLAYLFDSSDFRTQIRTAVKGVKVYSVTQAILRNANVWLPSLSEQQKIASFLDHETAKIDTLIAKQEKLIELLKEKRQAVISHAVTKGLNPDVPMKDSGVEWLGEVPEHWAISKLKWKTHTTSGGTPSTSKYELYYEGGYIPWIRTTDLNNDKLMTTPVRITEKALKDTACSILPKESVLIAMYGGAGSIGKHSLLNFEATINQAVCGIYPSQSFIPEYLHYFYEFYRPFWMVNAAGTRKDPNIGQDHIKEGKLPLPPKEEQKEIVAYVNKTLDLLTTLNDKAAEAIEFAKERKTALISAAVTGKIDVRDWQPPVQAEALET